MEDLAIGELVIMQHADHFHEWDGALGVVVGLQSRRRAMDMPTMRLVMLDAYRVRILDPNGITVICERHQLRKLEKFDEDAAVDEACEHEAPEAEFTD